MAPAQALLEAALSDGELADAALAGAGSSHERRQRQTLEARRVPNAPHRGIGEETR